MSWDITFQKLPEVQTLADIPEDFMPESVAPRELVIAQIVEAVPSADFTDPAWGLIDGVGWSIEVNIGEEQECTGFMLHVRGGGEDVIRVITAIGRSTRLRGIDCQTGEFFEPTAALESFGVWQTYRDQITEKVHAPRSPRKRGLFSRIFG